MRLPECGLEKNEGTGKELPGKGDAECRREEGKPAPE